MTRLFAEPIPVVLSWSEGELESLLLEGRRLSVAEVVRRWRVDGEWWDDARCHARDYLTVRTVDGMLCDLALDRPSGCWSLQRMYD